MSLKFYVEFRNNITQNEAVKSLFNIGVRNIHSVDDSDDENGNEYISDSCHSKCSLHDNDVTHVTHVNDNDVIHMRECPYLNTYNRGSFVDCKLHDWMTDMEERLNNIECNYKNYRLKSCNRHKKYNKHKKEERKEKEEDNNENEENEENVSSVKVSNI